MSFPQKVVDDLLVACKRSCCICHKFCGTRIQIHHIVPESKGGGDTAENAIALCLDCHAEVGSYNREHPMGRKFTASELRKHRENWLKLCSSISASSDDEESVKFSGISWVPEREFFLTSDNNLNCLIVIDSLAESMDVVAASMLAAKIEGFFYKMETVSLPKEIHAATLHSIAIGKPVVITPKTLSSLWFLDDWKHARNGNANDMFDSWETHEEIQIRFASKQTTNHSRNLFLKGAIY
ncbi:MAG: HNH endonuclease [Theionarchaea archaeon]|nr:HNH endonuclease [Theionarchaea archaeon]